MTSSRQRTFSSLTFIFLSVLCTKAQFNFNDTQNETSQAENSTTTMLPGDSNMTTMDMMSTSPTALPSTLATILMNGSGFQPQEPMGMPAGQFPFQNGQFPPPPPQPGQFPPPPGYFPPPNNQFPQQNGQYPQPPPQFGQPGQPGMMPSQEGLPGGGINHPGMPGQQGMQDSSTQPPTTSPTTTPTTTSPTTTTSSTTITSNPDPDPDDTPTTSGTVVVYPVPEGKTLPGNQSGPWMPGKFPPPGLSSPGPNDGTPIPNEPSLPRFFDVPDDKTKYNVDKDHMGPQGDDPSVKPGSTDINKESQVEESMWKKIETMVETERTVMSSSAASTPRLVTWATLDLPHGTGIGYSKEIGSQKATQKPGAATCVTITSLLLGASIFLAFFI